MPNPKEVRITVDYPNDTYSVDGTEAPAVFEVQPGGHLKFVVKGAAYCSVLVLKSPTGKKGTDEPGRVISESMTFPSGNKGPNVLKVGNKKVQDAGCDIRFYCFDENGQPLAPSMEEHVLLPGGPRMKVGD